jgi:DNA ligase-1
LKLAYAGPERAKFQFKFYKITRLSQICRASSEGRVLRIEHELVPFAKAYSGLTNAEFEEITRWVNQNTLERFGPVSVVPPEHVFELHFEGIGKSSRHKSGIAVRFPRIHRWRKDKGAEEADTIETLIALIP